MNDIWIHDNHPNGFSAVLDFEDEYLSVSVGSGNRVDELHMPVISFRLRLVDLTVYGGKLELDAWREMKTTAMRRKLAFQIIMENLNPLLFKTLLDETFKRGCKEGRNAVRTQIKLLLAAEF